VLSAPGSQTHPSLSPDGTLLLYQSDESGRMEVHLRSFPEGAGHWQASTRGGSQPRWSFKGDRIYYLEGDALMEVEVTRAPAPILGTPKKIFDLDGKPALQPGYDVSPDGRSFAFVHEIQPEGGPPKVLTLVEHWEQEFMRRKAP
jgi:dipeptidyl aminopeptidase/acylaminoacyl peptidase